MLVLYFIAIGIGLLVQRRSAARDRVAATLVRRTVNDTRASIVADYPFELDRFQTEALDAIDAGRHVVVAAPTGSGKTVVAEYGIETMRRRGRRAFYTAPLKALSNQKFRDLSATATAPARSVC